MFQTLRNAPSARLVLVLAAVLSIGASFGLHPEPIGNEGAPAQAALTSRAARPDAAPHRCLACLAFGAVLLAPAAAVPVCDDLLPGEAPRESADLSGRLAAFDLPGRSPPVRS